MKKVFLFLLLLLILLPMSAIQAKRMAPTPVDTISFNGVTYSAPTSMMGVVEARDEKADQILWTTKVYSVAYDSNLEKDAQDVFITKLEVANEKLLVTNERNQKYQVDLRTGEVTSVPDTSKAPRSGWLIATVVFALGALFALYKYLLK